MSGAVAMGFVIAILTGTVGFLLGVMAWSLRDQVRGTRYAVWRDFGLSIALAILFLSSWGAQAITQWQEFTDEQATHQQEASPGDFAAAFATSTLENWQSEFLQLFSFVVLSAMLIHRGSAESKDSDDRIEESLARIEKTLGTSPEEPVAAPTRRESETGT